MRVIAVPVLADNYSWLIIDESDGVGAIVDCAEVEPVLAAVEREGIRLVAVLSTHHHYDHVGGNEALAQKMPLRIYGNADDAGRIPGLTDGVREGESIEVGKLRAEVLFIPAHTSGHIAYYFPREQAIFTGDTLFAAGCGRLFEGDPPQMLNSLRKIAELPAETRVYCGHEYTVRNLEFAQSLEPDNKAIDDKLAWARARRRDGKPTLPTTLASERETNPFLRSDVDELRASVRHLCPDAVLHETAEVFAATRRLKDSF